MTIKIMADNNEIINVSQDAALYNVFAGNNDFIIGGIGNNMVFNSNAASLNATLGSGEAVICGRHITIIGTESITLSANSNGYIVLRYDLTQTGSNMVRLLAVDRIYSDNLNNTGSIHDLLIGEYITNGSGVSTFTDRRKVITSISDTVASSGSAAKLTNARTIRVNLASSNAASFDGTANITPGVSGILPVANGGTGTNTLASVNVGSATKLQTGRTITTNLASTTTSPTFDGSANINIATTGTLPASKGGTGATSLANINVGSATKLATARSIRVNLASSSAVNFDGTANITPGITGTLPVGNGGTGATSLANINVGSASKLQTARTIALTGAISGSGSFDGSGNLSITTSINTAPTILYGTSEPTASQGKNGDIYVVYS